jgi:hypothetical protein
LRPGFAGIGARVSMISCFEVSPAYYCAPIKADSSDDQKVYCEGWRVIRKGW